MSKRFAADSPASKKCKVESLEVITISDGCSTEPLVKTSTYKPVPTGPRARVFQRYVLDYELQVELCISLCGRLPEVRFASPDGTIIMFGAEFLDMSKHRDSWSEHPIFLNTLKLRPTGDGGFQFLGSELGRDYFPCKFELSAKAAKRLCDKLDIMCAHVSSLIAIGDVIDVMFNCVVDFYKCEYIRYGSFLPRCELFDDLRQLVDRYIPMIDIVRDFVDVIATKGMSCPFNYYNLCTLVISQKDHLRSLL